VDPEKLDTAFAHLRTLRERALNDLTTELDVLTVHGLAHEGGD
jgi:hypothetical protein